MGLDEACTGASGVEAVDAGQKARKSTSKRRQIVFAGCGLVLLVPLLYVGWFVAGFLTYSQPAWTVAWSADSKTLAVGYGGYGSGGRGGIGIFNQDTTVRLWKVDHLDSAPTMLREHTSRVLGLAFSPDGRWLATGDGRTAYLWDLSDLQATPKSLIDNKYPDTGTQSMAFSPDSSWLASAGGGYNEVGLWVPSDPGSGPRGLPTPKDTYMSSVAFLPDNRTLVAAGNDGVVRFWDADTRKELKTLPNTGAGIDTVVVSRDGKHLAGAGEEGVMRLWDLGNLEAPPVRLAGERALYAPMDISPDSKLLVGATGDEFGNGKLLLWDLAQPNVLPKEILRLKDRLTSAKYSPDGQWLAVSSSDGQLRVWAANRLSDSPRTVNR